MPESSAVVINRTKGIICCRQIVHAIALLQSHCVYGVSLKIQNVYGAHRDEMAFFGGIDKSVFGVYVCLSTLVCNSKPQEL